MPSKRDLIKEFRVEVKRLEDKIEARAKAYGRLEQKLISAKDKHHWDNDDHRRQCKFVAKSIKKILDAELMWQELTDDPTTQMYKMKQPLRTLESMGGREE